MSGAASEPGLRDPFDSRGCLKFRLGNLANTKVVLSRDTCLRGLNVIIKLNRFCYYVQEEEFWRRKLVRVMISTFLI